MRKNKSQTPRLILILRKALPFLPIALILLVGALLRFYRIRDYLVFLGDEGRDVLVVKRMLVDHRFTLLGPITSTGGMYLGPIYYYFITPFLWLFGYDPVGPAIMVALFGVAAIFLVYKTGRDFFDEKIGLFAALLFATSPTVIIYSRSSWNPNILPFFSLFIIYSLLKLVNTDHFVWLFFAGFAFGISLQLHYLALLFILVFVLVSPFYRNLLGVRNLALFGLGAISTFWPFLLFELRHRFPNTQTIWQFITKTGADNTFGIELFLPRSKEILIRLFDRLVIYQTSLTKLIIIVLITFLTLTLYQHWQINKRLSRSLLLLFVWLLAGVFSYSFYQGVVYDYYFAPVFTLPFLLVGFLLAKLYSHGKLARIATLSLLGLLLFSHIKHSPLRVEPNRLVDQSARIARFIVEKTEGREYNFALISAGNSDHAYRYFLELWGYSPVTIKNKDLDPERKTVTGQLLVVCEDKKCQPLGHSLWEIAGFDQAQIVGVWEVFPVKIIRMLPYQPL